MASCAYCDSFILFGGVKDAELRYCSAKCAAKGQVLRVARSLPAELVEKQVRAVHAGNCPQCGGPGPVDVHTSHRAMSALVVTQWSSHPLVSCVKCGTRAQLRNSAITLALGWWGLPWGLIMTPVQIGKNVVGMIRKPDPRQPTETLQRVVSTRMASQAIGARK